RTYAGSDCAETLSCGSTADTTRLRAAQTPSTMPIAIVRTTDTITIVSVCIACSQTWSRTISTRATATTTAARVLLTIAAIPAAAAMTSHHGDVVRTVWIGSSRPADTPFFRASVRPAN